MINTRALDYYRNKKPTLQNAIDIFEGEWSSYVPESERSGEVPLFSDPRLSDWINKVRDYHSGTYPNCQLRALELGPLEGGHTYMMQSEGWGVTCIESNARAFLKTLIVCNHFGLAAKVLHGDFIPFLENPETPEYDFILACGVLYHMKNPLALIDLICAKCKSFGLWSHFVTDNFMAKYPGRWSPEELSASGTNYIGYKQFYGIGLESDSFCGGRQEYAYWVKEGDIKARILGHGFDIELQGVDHDHPNGPCLTLFAFR